LQPGDDRQDHEAAEGRCLKCSTPARVGSSTELRDTQLAEPVTSRSTHRRWDLEQIFPTAWKPVPLAPSVAPSGGAIFERPSPTVRDQPAHRGACDVAARPRSSRPFRWRNRTCSEATMAKKQETGPAPICQECGARTTYRSTAPKAGDRPPLLIYVCDHCETMVTVPKDKRPLRQRSPAE
jgi:DNA-directed RNA polymerase subunit M/transcription elongation factor TFIIS